METAAAIGEREGRAVYAGYSMGGRLCLRLALDRPDLVRGLVLLSASPGIADDAERATGARPTSSSRRRSSATASTRSSTGGCANPCSRPCRPTRAGLDERRAGNTVATLTHAAARLGQGAQPSLWERLGELSMPVLLIVGGLDAKYVDIA